VGVEEIGGQMSTIKDF